ncbi:MAG: hypothetical protein ACRD52_16430 [Candidatus Acidiferrales bacterium]
MIEVYLFLAMFAVQILGMSVLYPVLFTRFIRTGLKNIPAERLAELYPGVDVGQAHERFLARYRAANTVVAVLGLLLLGWFIRYMQRPNWDAGAVGGMVTAYFLLQCFPIILIAWFTVRFNKVHRLLLREPRRKAILQRRGLFDFVSPITVLLAILAYSQFVAFMFYVERHPFPGFGGPFANIGILSLMYVLLGGFVMYLLYGRKRDPLLKHADRMRMISGVANYNAWMLILTSISLSLNTARKLVDLETWGPFAGIVFLLIITLLTLRTVRLPAPPRQPEADGLGSSPVR